MKKKIPTVQEIMDAAGISRKAAVQRLYRYKKGRTTYAALLTKKGEKPSSYTTCHKRKRQIACVMERVQGITSKTAARRVDNYNTGRWDAEQCFQPPRTRNSIQEKLDAIPSATQWERENLGAP